MYNNKMVNNNRLSEMIRQTSKDILEKKIYNELYLDNIVKIIYNLEKKL